MQEFKVEFLVITDSKGAFCNSISSFNNLMRSNDDISIEANKLTFRSLQIGYEVQFGNIVDAKQKFFHLRLTCPREDQILEFGELLKAIRTLLYKVADKAPQVLWDDISSFYANKAYPLVHEIENIMRKLITKFMLTNIGLGWTKEAVPQEVIESVRNKAAGNSQNYLHEVDFIQLSNFLFNEYTTINTKALLEKIREASKSEDLNLEFLKQSIPQSNWERYFSPLVDCDSEYLKVRWDKLYDIRCQVAHNKSINKSDLEQIEVLGSELKSKLLSAIDSLDKIHLSEEDRETVAENVAGNVNALHGEYIALYKQTHERLIELARMFLVEEEQEQLVKFGSNLRTLLNILTKQKNVIPKQLREEILEALVLRNVIVHHSDVTFSEASIQKKIELLKACYSQIAEILNKVERGKIDYTEIGSSVESDDDGIVQEGSNIE